jgi:ribosomal protein L12E/L44/L45/RPP1/RPP2
MGLLDDIRAHDTSGNRQRCRVQVILSSIEGDDRDDLVAALKDGMVPATAIAAALQARGHDVNGGSVARHRRGACVCPR